MKLKKMNICLLLPDTFDPHFPARPEITEVYGNYLSQKHNFIWVMPCLTDCDSSFEIFENTKIIKIHDDKYAFFPVRVYYFLKHYFNKYRVLNRIFREEKCDLIHIRNNIWDALLALYLRKRFEIPLVFQYTFPKDAYKFEKSPKFRTKISGKLEETLTRYIMKRCDFIFPISDWMKSNLVHDGTSESKIMTIPMGANINSFNPQIKGDHIRRKYGLNDSKVILYLGSLNKLRQLEMIIRTFDKLNKTEENIKLMVVGDGNDRKDLEKLTESLSLDDKVVFTGKIPYLEIPKFIVASDICLSPIPPLDLYKISSPTKLFEYMSMEKPVVANREIPEQEKILKECNCGILADFNYESFAQGIKYLLDHPQEAESMGQNGRVWVVKNRSYETMAQHIEEVYFRLISGLIII